jgi:hypothetical protein
MGVLVHVVPSVGMEVSVPGRALNVVASGQGDSTRRDVAD